MSKRRDLVILCGMIVLYVAIFGILTAFRHARFETQAWDLGIFEQLFWNMAHGHGPVTSIELVRNHFAAHMSPWLFALLPGYLLFESPYYLLFVQTLALGLGALPLYFLARKLLRDKTLSLLLAGGYLLYPSLHWTNIYDFHEIAFFIPLFLAAIYFLEEERWGWMSLFLVLAASTREDAVLAVLFAGLYLILRGRRRIGIAVAMVSLAYFVVSVAVVMPALGGGILNSYRYAYFGEAFARPGILFQKIFTPGKSSYLARIFFPTLLMPFAAPLSLFFFVPGLLENLLADYPPQSNGFLHYDAIVAPGLFAALAYGLRALLRRNPARRAVLVGALVISFSLGLVYSPIGPVLSPTYPFRENPRGEMYQRMIRAVPDDVSAAAPINLVPHLAHRAEVYMLGAEPSPPDVVLIDESDFFGFPDGKAFRAYIDRYLSSGRYEATTLHGRYLILKRRAQ